MITSDTSIIEIRAEEVAQALRSQFNRSDPASVRSFAVLDGHAAGRIFTDHVDHPSWAVLQEATFGSLYLAGEVPQPTLHQLMARLRLDGDMLVGMWQDDPRWSLLPSDPDYSGYTLEFIDREAPQTLPELPAGCTLRRLDATLFKQIVGRNLLIHMYGSVQHALEWGYGLCLLAGMSCCVRHLPAQQLTASSR